MITETDLQEAIAECQGQRNPNASTCIKLAAFYTIRRELFGEEKEAGRLPVSPGYSYAMQTESEPMIENDSDSAFAQAINGRPAVQSSHGPAQGITLGLFSCKQGKKLLTIQF